MARVGRGFPAHVIFNRFRGESTKPTYSVAPAAAAIGASTVDFTATATDDLGGTLDHFCGLYAAGSTPTAAQVIAGTGTGFIAADSELAVTSGVAAAFTQFTGIAHNGFPYRGAFTARDSYGNLATVTYVDFRTILGLATIGEAEVSGFAGILGNVTQVTLASLAYRNGVLRANEINLHWAWFDEDDIATVTTPTDAGTAGQTDSLGNALFYLANTTLTSGQVGRFILETADKVSLGSYRVTIP